MLLNVSALNVCSVNLAQSHTIVSVICTGEWHRSIAAIICSHVHIANDRTHRGKSVSLIASILTSESVVSLSFDDWFNYRIVQFAQLSDANWKWREAIGKTIMMNGCSSNVTSRWSLRYLACLMQYSYSSNLLSLQYTWWRVSKPATLIRSRN